MVLVILVLSGALFVVIVRPWSDPASAGGPGRGAGPLATPVIVDADTHGALVLDTWSNEMIGLDASGAVRWRDRDLASRLSVSCLAQCPDAVGSGSADGSGSPAVIWRTGNRRSDVAASGVVLWANSPKDALSVRSEAGGDVLDVLGPGAAHRSYPLDSFDTQLFTAPDGARAVLVSGGSAYRVLDRTVGGWTMSPPRTASVRSACVGKAGQPTILFDGDHTFVLDATGRDLRALPITNVGRCGIGRQTQVTQRFRDDTATGAHTSTRLIDPAGHVVWERTDTGIHPGDIDDQTGLVALPTDTELLVLDHAGSPITRIPDVADARFVTPGCLLMVRPDTHVFTQCG